MWIDSVAQIFVMEEGVEVRKGTGFLIGPRTVLTCWHVVFGEGEPARVRREIQVAFVGHQQRQDPITGGQQLFDAVLVQDTGDTVGDATQDWVLLECSPNVELAPLPLAPLGAGEALRQDLRWDTYGFPDGAQSRGDYFRGYVNGQRAIDQVTTVLQLYSWEAAQLGKRTAGLSGAPVVVDGVVVGMMHGVLPSPLAVALGQQLGLPAQNSAASGGTLYASLITGVVQILQGTRHLATLSWGLPDLPKDLDLPWPPFRDLAPYTEADAAIFFGRNDDIRALYYQVSWRPKTPSLLLLFGHAGAGKSSVLAAGVIPRLKALEVDGRRVHRVIYRRRSAGLESDLRQALNVSAGGTIVDAIKRAGKGHEKVILFLDQAEEAFTQSRGDRKEEVRTFFQRLVEVTREASLQDRFTLILGYRKEWHAEIADLAHAHQLDPAMYELRPLDQHQSKEVIEGLEKTPGLKSRYRLTIKPEVTKRLCHQVDLARSAAPLLQVQLTWLWKKAPVDDSGGRTFDDGLFAGVKEGTSLQDLLRRQLRWQRLGRLACGMESGLALDILHHHTSPQGTSEERTPQERSGEYGAGRLPFIEEFVRRLAALSLLVLGPPDRDGNQSSRLIHDALAPVVQEEFRRSRLRGPRARRVLERGSQEDGLLDAHDLRIAREGLDGMRQFRPEEARKAFISALQRDPGSVKEWAKRWSEIERSEDLLYEAIKNSVQLACSAGEPERDQKLSAIILSLSLLLQEQDFESRRQGLQGLLLQFLNAHGTKLADKEGLAGAVASLVEGAQHAPADPNPIIDALFRQLLAGVEPGQRKLPARVREWLSSVWASFKGKDSKLAQVPPESDLPARVLAKVVARQGGVSAETSRAVEDRLRELLKGEQRIVAHHVLALVWRTGHDTRELPLLQCRRVTIHLRELNERQDQAQVIESRDTGMHQFIAFGACWGLIAGSVSCAFWLQFTMHPFGASRLGTPVLYLICCAIGPIIAGGTMAWELASIPPRSAVQAWRSTLVSPKIVVIVAVLHGIFFWAAHAVDGLDQALTWPQLLSADALVMACSLSSIAHLRCFGLQSGRYLRFRWTLYLSTVAMAVPVLIAFLLDGCGAAGPAFLFSPTLAVACAAGGINGALLVGARPSIERRDNGPATRFVPRGYPPLGLLLLVVMVALCAIQFQGSMLASTAPRVSHPDAEFLKMWMVRDLGAALPAPAQRQDKNRPATLVRTAA